MDKDKVLELMKKAKSNGTAPEVKLESPPDDSQIVEFNEVEKQIITGAMAEAQQSIKELEQLQQMVQQKRDTMLGLTKAADKVYRAVMILKRANPDAYELSWNPQTGELLLKRK